MLEVARFWGSTAEERAGIFPCDRHIPDPHETLFRAVDVAAPAPVVFRWLCQLRVAPYSYDWIDNWGRQSPRHLVPGLEDLAIGQRAMTFFELVDFERDRHVTAVLRAPGAQAVFGDLAVSYMVVPRGPARARLVVKLLVRWAWRPLAWAIGPLLAWGDLVMMRRQLLNLKALAEGGVRCASSDARAP